MCVLDMQYMMFVYIKAGAKTFCMGRFFLNRDFAKSIRSDIF